MPSTVVMSGPSSSSEAQLIASMVQLSVGTPSTSTVHAPQDESSHPRFDPVKSSSWRRTSSSSSLGPMASSCLRPFTRSSMSSFFMMKLLATGCWLFCNPEPDGVAGEGSLFLQVASDLKLYPNL